MKPSSGWLSRKRRREAAYQRGYEDGLSAATASSDPIAYLRHGEQTFVQNVPFGAIWISDKDDPHSFPVYDRPQPAPSVAVKAIEAVWKYSLVIESNVRRGDGPDQYAGVTEALRLVKEARSALSAQVQDVAERKPLNLNITKEWFEKRAALEGDHEIGAGRLKLIAGIDPSREEGVELHWLAYLVPEGWQLVPIEPTQEMCEAAPSLPAIDVIGDLPLKKAGWSMSAIVNRKRYLAMLAAARPKQEGGE